MMELDDKTILLNNYTSQEVKRLCSIELKERKLQDRHVPSALAYIPGHPGVLTWRFRSPTRPSLQSR